MRRREFLISLGTTAACAIIQGCVQQAVKNSRKSVARPNIVFMLSDDMGWNQLGFQGCKLIPTPNIDNLAQSGAILNQFYVQPVCTPTRSAFLTGRYPFRTGTVIRFTINDTAGMLLDERTLAQALKDAGYFTAILGKWHLGEWKKAHLPMQRGFDYQYGHYTAMIDSFEHTRDGVLDWHRNEQPLDEEGYSTFLIAKEAVKLIDKQDVNKPFFFYIPFNAVHAPSQAPQEMVDAYKKKLAANPNKVPSPQLAAQLECMDIAVGQIVNAIDKKGIRNNTIIVFTNDNGSPKIPLNAPLRGDKNAYYEGGIRVPAVISWPGRIKPGTVVNEMLHIVDMYPTFINLAGGSLKQPLPVDGKDAWDTIANGRPTPHDEIVFGTECIRKGDWKYIDKSAKYYAWKAKVSQLYNIKNDPYEQHNLIEQHPDIAGQLKKRLEYYATQVRPSEEHQPIPNYPPTVYGEEESKTYKKKHKFTKTG